MPLAAAVASFALVGLLICVARFLFVHVMGFETRAADSEAEATAEEEAASMKRKLQRVTPVIIIQPNQEVPQKHPTILLLSLSILLVFTGHSYSGRALCQAAMLSAAASAWLTFGHAVVSTGIMRLVVP